MITSTRNWLVLKHPFLYMGIWMILDILKNVLLAPFEIVYSIWFVYQISKDLHDEKP